MSPQEGRVNRTEAKAKAKESIQDTGKPVKAMRKKQAVTPVAAFVPLQGTESMSLSWQHLYKEISKEIRQ